MFARKLTAGDQAMTALPVPVADAFRADEQQRGYPELGEANDLLKSN